MTHHAAADGSGYGQTTLRACSSVTDCVAGKSGGGFDDEFDCCSVHLVTIANSSIMTGNRPDNCDGNPDQIPNCVD